MTELHGDQKFTLRQLLEPGAALALVLDMLEEDAVELALQVARVDFDTEEGGLKARKLQARQQGIIQCIDRIKEIVNEDSDEPQPD